MIQFLAISFHIKLSSYSPTLFRNDFHLFKHPSPSLGSHRPLLNLSPTILAPGEPRMRLDFYTRYQ